MWLGGFIGVDPILSARLFFTVLSALCCALLCVLARDTLGSRAAGFLAPAVFLTFQGFIHLASDGPREKTTMVVFLLGCLILLGRRRWALAGACAALATLSWQPVLAVTLGVLVAAALLDQQATRRRILLRFTVGGLVPSLVTVVYFLGAGALSRAIDGFIVINVRYTEQPSAADPPTSDRVHAVVGVPLDAAARPRRAGRTDRAGRPGDPGRPPPDGLADGSAAGHVRRGRPGRDDLDRAGRQRRPGPVRAAAVRRSRCRRHGAAGAGSAASPGRRVRRRCGRGHRCRGRGRGVRGHPQRRPGPAARRCRGRPRAPSRAMRRWPA